MNNDSEKKNDFIKEPPIQSLHTLDADLLASMKSENYASNIVKVVTHSNATKEDATTPALHTLKQIKNTSSFKIDVNSKGFYIGLSIFLTTIIGFSTYYIVNKTIQDILPKTPVATSVVATSTQTTSTTLTVPKGKIFNAEVLVPIQVADLTRFQIIQTINTIKVDLLTNKVKANINIGLIPDIGLNDFFNKIQYSGPETLIRSFDASKIYSFGLYHTQKDQFQTYFITKIDIFDLAFSGMLDWEYAMPVDLANIYTTISSTASTTETLTSTTTQQKITPTTTTKKVTFTDKIIKNIDTRVYVDPVKGTQIIYGFINKEYLLITSGEEVFIDIVNKLTINNILR